MIEFENLIADAVLVKARKPGAAKKGRSKKWRRLVYLTNISEAEEIRSAVREISYRYVVDRQPIGKKLFERFCSRDPILKRAVHFLERVGEYIVTVNEKRGELAKQIFDQFLSSSEDVGVVQGVTAEHVETVRAKLEARPCSAGLFDPCRRASRDFLSGEPFSNFSESIYFRRYLQFKWMEKQPILFKVHFRDYRTLGKGGFGIVSACQSKSTGKMYALKKLEKKRVKKHRGEQLALNEKVILEKLSSRFIVSLAYAFESKDCLCLVLTLMNGGDLKYHIHHIGDAGLVEQRAVFYAAEIACGLRDLHRANIVYRDMKPENILMDDEGHVRISDFGLADILRPPKKSHGRVGTVGYMAPEVVRNEDYHFAADWWGFGAVVYEMTAGTGPFRAPKEKISREDVEKRVLTEEPKYGDKFSPEAKEICMKLLDKNPDTRLSTFDEIRELPYFRHIDWAQLQAGVAQPAFVPDPCAVYCHDVLDIDTFSVTKGVTLEEKDEDFYRKFTTGCVSEPWQSELIEMGVFDELNVFGPDDTATPDLIEIDLSAPKPRNGFLSRMKSRLME